MYVPPSPRCNLMKQPNGEFLVAVDHNQQRSMASEIVDPIEWSHPNPHAKPSTLNPTLSVLCIV